jgi:hypothetical protein
MNAFLLDNRGGMVERGLSTPAPFGVFGVAETLRIAMIIIVIRIFVASAHGAKFAESLRGMALDRWAGAGGWEERPSV